MNKQSYVKSIEKALKILNCFSEANFELDLSQIVQTVHLPKTTVYRILCTLEKEGIVSQNDENKKYRLGLKLFELGSLVFRNLKLREEALPLMEKLSEESGETVHLGILDKHEVISIETTDSPFSLRSSVYIGKRAPAYCTGVGKALLAFQPPEKMRVFLQNNKLRRYTVNTITDLEELKKQLKRIKGEEYAIDNMEHEEGVRCVAAPIRGYKNKVVASISISGPSIRITEERIPQLISMVKETAQAISKKLGARNF